MVVKIGHIDVVTAAMAVTMILLAAAAFRHQLRGLIKRYGAFTLPALTAIIGIAAITFAGLKWPVPVIVALLTLIASSLIIISVVATLLYSRMSGVNLHYVDFLLQNKRRTANPTQRAPYGMQ